MLSGITEGKETCSTLLLFCGTPKIIPASANNIVTRIIHSRVLSREHRAELEFRSGIAAINNNYTHSLRFRQNASHLHVLLILELTHASTPECSLDDGAGRHVSPHPPPIPLVYTANLIGVDPSMCIPLCTILSNWFGHITEILCANSRIIRLS